MSEHSEKRARGTKVDLILQTLYQSVTTLETWIRQTDTEGVLMDTSLFGDNDPRGYKHLLETTLVAVKEDAKKLSAPLSPSQYLHQNELVAMCIRRVLQRDGAGNNVLSFGFGPITDNPRATVSSFALDIESRYTNSSESRLQSKEWQTLLSRIGDTLMGHLLVNTSVFVLLIKPAVYVQITGEPVYQLWPFSSKLPVMLSEHCSRRKKPASKKNQRKPKKGTEHAENGLVKCETSGNSRPLVLSEGGGNSYQSHQILDSSQSVQLFNGFEEAQKTTSNLEPICGGSQKTTSNLEPVCGGSQKTTSNLEPICGGSQKTTSNFEPVCGGSQKTTSNFELLRCGSKRKRLDVALEKCCKRPKLRLTDDGEASLLSASDISVTVVPETSGSSAENVSADGVQSMETNWGGKHQVPGAPSLTKRQKKRMKKKRKKQTPKLCTPDARAYQHHLFIPRLHLLYGKYLREKFPAEFILSILHPTEAGAQKLCTAIFGQDSVGGNLNRTVPCQCQQVQPVSVNDSCSTSSTPSQSSSLPCSQKNIVRGSSELGRFGPDSEVKAAQSSKDRMQSMKHGDKPTQEKLQGESDRILQTRENRIPVQILGEERETLGCSNVAESSNEIIVEDSPLLFETSYKSSSSVAISNPSSESAVESSQGVDQSGLVGKKLYPDNTDDSKFQQGSITSSHKGRLHRRKEASFRSKKTEAPSTAAAECHKGRVTNEHSVSEVSQAAQEQGPRTLQDTLNSPVFLGKILPLLENFLASHRKCNYRSFLNRHCRNLTNKKKKCCQSAAGDSKQGQSSSKGTEYGMKHWKTFEKRPCDRSIATAKMLEDYLPHQKVFAFLRSVVKHTIPVQLIGSSANMAVFLKNIHCLVSSGKFERMCLGQLMKGMKVKGCNWLNSVPCLRAKEHCLAQLVWWLVVRFVFPLIRTFFYVTDTTTYRNRLFYYRKSTWLKLKIRAVQEFRKATCLKAISKSQVGQWLASGQMLGVSVLRFLPKARSLRPIVNMSSRPKQGSEQKKSVNKQLNRLFQVLSCEKALDDSMCGYSVFGLEDINKRLKHFKQQRAAQQDDRKLYFVKSDIRNCFDSVQQHQLFQFVKDIFTKSNESLYMTRKYASLHMSGRRLKRAFHADTARFALYQANFATFLRQKYSHGRWNDIIVVDMAFFQKETPASLLQVLSAHLFKNVIKIGGRHYVQTRGLSQGSVMSTLLACVYLARLEKAHLSVLQDELLMRRMDDYLLVTPDKARAKLFVHAMVKGFPDFNCFTNGEKILTNFAVDIPWIDAVAHTEQEGVFPWCGLMINACSLDVSVDYSRYSGLSVTDTATFDTSHRAGQTLTSKILMCLKIKCHAIFFDPELNSRERILLNAYQALLFVGLIFHSFVNKLPSSQRVESNPQFFVGIVNMIPTYMQNLVARKLQQSKCTHKFPIPIHILQWLNASALLARLNPYPGYKPLTKSLKAARLCSQKKLDGKSLAVLQEIHKTAKSLDSSVVLF